MSFRDLSVSDWVCMSDEVAKRECEALARTLPHGLEFGGLTTHGYCGRIHRLARFSLREAGGAVEFVLVPGGEVSLGFDGHDFKASHWQNESFSESARHYDIDPSITRFVDSQTSPRRDACISPMLVETEAREIVPVEPVSESDAERTGNSALRVSRRSVTTLPMVEERLRRSGTRLLTCDEWEHACGAGTATLFRWGDDNPVDFYPTDTCAEDRLLKRAWVLSGGKLVHDTPAAKWDLHRRPNLFGLRIASDPYRSDLVADGPLALGGDGGCNICGGAGFFLGWLSLATAFRNPYEGPIGPDRNIAGEYHRLRRAISID